MNDEKMMRRVAELVIGTMWNMGCLANLNIGRDGPHVDGMVDSRDVVVRIKTASCEGRYVISDWMAYTRAAHDIAADVVHDFVEQALEHAMRAPQPRVTVNTVTGEVWTVIPERGGQDE